MSLCPRIRRDHRNVLGKHALIRFSGELVGAQVIDRVAGRNLSKRVRIETGEHAGEVVMRGQYQLMEFCERNELVGLLALAWE